jgi:hypothetical protein
MVSEFPYTNKPEDIAKLLNLLPVIEPPKNKADKAYIKSLGFSASSSDHLHNILKLLGFIDDSDKATVIWAEYRADQGKRGRLFAACFKQAYLDLFERTMCPYLEDDGSLYDIFKNRTKASEKKITFMLETFRVMNEFADYQDLMDGSKSNALLTPATHETEPQVIVNPNLQWNIQVHIDPNTPDDKIETIFKNMRKYLLGKED